MGEVYLAIQTGLGGFEKPLALKLLLPHLAEKPQTVQRFLAEAQVAAKMNHVNVAQIFDVGTERGRYFIAMELVRGVSLSVLIKALKMAKRQLPPDLIALIARGVCDGLHHAHSLGVVHRDVTPHNVMVSVDGAVKLTDFGIARVDGAARPGKVEGKAAYVAPELVLGGPFDHRSDLFSLGVSLYQLATLESPFHRSDDSSSMQAVTRDMWTPLAMVRPDLEGPLSQTIERASAKDPNARFSDARAMRDALPPAHPASTDDLSKLVQVLCSKALEELDARTKVLGTLVGSGPATGSGSDSHPGTQSLPLDRPATIRRPLIAFAVALAASAGLFFLAWPHGGPAPVRAPAAVEGPKVSATPPAPVPASPSESTPPSPAPAEGAVEAEEPVSPGGTETGEASSALPRVHHVRKPSPRPAGTGYLTINAVPWAEVRVDGKLVGETPIAKYPLDADGKQHEIELRNPETKRTVKRSVKIGDGQHAFVKADLK
jgi:serine/threonine-protein kinase